MEISNTLAAKLNEQVTNEFNASQIYLAMACMFENMSLKMLAAWFRKQSDEERGHALKLVDYLLSRQNKVSIGPVPAPAPDYPSVLAAIETALRHEQKVTGQIHALRTLADQENDYASQSFIDWFVNEQVEEEESVGHLLNIAKMAGPAVLQLEAYMIHMSRTE